MAPSPGVSEVPLRSHGVPDHGGSRSSTMARIARARATPRAGAPAPYSDASASRAAPTATTARRYPSTLEGGAGTDAPPISRAKTSEPIATAGGTPAAEVRFQEGDPLQRGAPGGGAGPLAAPGTRRLRGRGGYADAAAATGAGARRSSCQNTSPWVTSSAGTTSTGSR